MKLCDLDEYIKKDELLKFKADVYDEDGHVLYAVPTGCIVAMPPADVAPVVRCEKCVLHGNCATEDAFVFAKIENPFCCAGKRKESAEK